MEELEAIREAEEAALAQAEAAAEEAAANLNIFEEDDLGPENLSLYSNDNGVTTPSTRSLSREKSPETEQPGSSRNSFENPTVPLQANKSEAMEAGMTNSALFRHVKNP